MPRQFYGVRKEKNGYWIVVNKEGSILSDNGYPLMPVPGSNSADQFGCETYSSFLKKRDAEKLAEEWERSCLIFGKPKMSSKELLFVSLGHVDWILASIGVLCIIKVFWK